MTLTVAAAPALSVTPASLSFSATAGGASPASKTLSVANTGGGTLSFTASDDAPWLSVTPGVRDRAAATSPCPRDVSGLAAGTYTGNVTVDLGRGDRFAQGRAGHLHGRPAPATPVLAVTPANLSFSAVAGGRESGRQDLQRHEHGHGLADLHGLRRRAVAVGRRPASGTAPEDVTVSVDTAGLAAGTYTGKVTVTSRARPAPEGRRGDARGHRRRRRSPSLPRRSPSAAPRAAPDPAAKTLSVTNTGGGSLSLTAADDASWLRSRPRADRRRRRSPSRRR